MFWLQIVLADVCMVLSVCLCLQSFQGWVLDKEFASKLDKDWDLHTVRDAAYAALAAVGREQLHFRPPDEQNDHKVTCGVKAEYADRVSPKQILSLVLSHHVLSLLASGRV